MKRVLVVVDMQNDFIDGSLGNKDCLKTLKPVIKEILNPEYDFIALTKDIHQKDYLKTLEGKNLPIEHCIENTFGIEINEDIMKALKESKKEYKIYDKKSFGSYSLALELESHQKTIKEITIVGLCSDICVVSNALMLRSILNNTPIYYIEEATAGVTRDRKKAALKVMEACQIYQKGKQDGTNN